MSPYLIGAIVAAAYLVVGIFAYALCKTSAHADQMIEEMFEEDHDVHDDYGA